MDKKVIIIPLTEFRQSLTGLWKKIKDENFQVLITVRGRPVLKVEKYENDLDNHFDQDREKLQPDTKKITKKWGGVKNSTTEIDWDNIL